MFTLRIPPSVQDNQKDLENATEQLSEYLERDITSDMLFDIKQKVQDKSRCVHSTTVVIYQLRFLLAGDKGKLECVGILAY